MKPYHFFFLILVFACQKDKQAPANNASETFPIPIIWIDTQSVPIDSKEDYVDATIVIEGGDPNHNLAETTTRIKGRGNSTWSLGLEWGKKPYQVKFSDKTEILGMPQDKKWVFTG